MYVLSDSKNYLELPYSDFLQLGSNKQKAQGRALSTLQEAHGKCCFKRFFPIF